MTAGTSPPLFAARPARRGHNRLIAERARPSAGQSRRGRARRALEALADWIVPLENPSGAIYGAIVIGALLAAESGRHETYLDTFVSALVATALYWLAHAYAGVLGRRLSGDERLTARTLLGALAHDWSIVRGAALPLGALVVSWASGAGQETAVDWALWSVVASLIAFEAIAGLRSRAAPSELAVEVAVGATMGLAILALKIILH